MEVIDCIGLLQKIDIEGDGLTLFFDVGKAIGDSLKLGPGYMDFLASVLVSMMKIGRKKRNLTQIPPLIFVLGERLRTIFIKNYLAAPGAILFDKTNVAIR